MAFSNMALQVLRRYRNAVEEVRVRTDKEGLHRLRVRMKRVRSLLRFLSHLDGEIPPPKRAVRRTTALFRTAGAVREVQIDLKLLRGLQQASQTAREVGRAHLLRKQERKEEHLRKALDRLRPEDHQRLELHVLRVLHGRTTGQVRKVARSYARSEQDRAATLCRATEAPLHLHKMRKHLKHVQHLHDLLKAGIPRSAGLSMVLDRLGEWHDALVLHHTLCTMHKHPVHRNELLAETEVLVHVRQLTALRRLHELLEVNARQRTRK